MRDTAQWSQLLLLAALALVYVYNFTVLDFERVPYYSREIKHSFVFVNLLMAGLVTSAVAVRFVFPAVSAEGASFWIVRTAPVGMKAFLWSKFWTGFVPVLVLAESLTVASNRMIDAILPVQWLAATAVFFLTLALVGLACGMGARFPRFSHESLTQVAGSYGGVAYMASALLLVLVTIALLAWPAAWLVWHHYRPRPMPPERLAAMIALLTLAAVACLATFRSAMRSGVRALEALG